jgi:hypothetical protein
MRRTRAPTRRCSDERRPAAAMRPLQLAVGGDPLGSRQISHVAPAGGERDLAIVGVIATPPLS